MFIGEKPHPTHIADFFPVLLFLLAPLCPATTLSVYYNRADWQAAVNSKQGLALTTIGLGDSQWSDRMQFLPRLTQRISQSSTAFGNGMGITAISEYSAPGLAANSSLGHVLNDTWTDNLSKYGSTTFDFSSALYGVGGDFDITGSNGLFITPLGEIGGGTIGYRGFIGFVTDQPVDSLFISWGDSGNCPNCFGNSYTLANLQTATLTSPEPGFGYALAFALILALGYPAYQKHHPQRTRS